METRGWGGGAGSVTVLSNNYIIGSKPWGKGENANFKLFGLKEL